GMSRDFILAKRALDAALKNDRGNRYLLDLSVRVEARLGNREEAEKMLGVLRMYDSSPYYYHREAWFKICIDDLRGALMAERTAFANMNNPPFEVWWQLINLEINNDNLSDAATLIEQMEENFVNQKRDFRLMLRA